MLRKLAELPEDVLQDCLAALDRAELLVRIDSELEDSLEFRHEMVRQVTYDLMVEKVREDIHARILAAFESDGTWSDEPDTLCYHAVRAKDWHEGVRSRQERRTKMSGRSAFADAANYFEIAMSALDKTPMTPLAGGGCDRPPDGGAHGIHLVRSGCRVDRSWKRGRAAGQRDR